MKLKELIERVDRSDSNRCDASIDNFCHPLGVEHYFGWSNEFCKKVQGYYAQKWLCTDTWVGIVVYYMDDEPVAASLQTGRKSDPEFEFLSVEAARKVREFIYSLIQEEEPTNFPIMDLEEEMGEHYNVEFSGQLLTNEGYVNGRKCIVVDKFRDDYISQKVKVKFEDGEELVVPVKEFKIPYSVV